MSETNTALGKTEKTAGFSIFKNLMPRSLLGRSLLILITPVFLIQIIAGLVFFDNHWKKMTDRLSFAVAGEIAIIANSLELDPSAENMMRVSGYAAQSLDLLISLQSPEEQALDKTETGFTFDRVWASMVAQSLAEQLRQHVRRPFTIDIDNQEKWMEVAIQLENGILRVSMPERRLFTSSSYIFILWLLGSSFVLLIIAVLFMRNQVRPIRRLAVAADRFGRGMDVPSFKPSGAREVRQASEAFIKMYKRLDRQLSQRTIMLAGVSHDLRTPLTRLKLELEMVEDSKAVQAMKDDILAMEKMIAGYLDFVSGESREDYVRANILTLFEAMKQKNQKQDYTIHIDAMDDLDLQLRMGSFERCLDNLIGNAGKYAQNIWLKALRTPEGKVELRIEDDGPGIDEAQYEDVFKPFFRLDESRGNNEGSVGLGLPIAMDIVHAHGGKIWLERSRHGGLCVVLSMPD